VQQRLPSRLDPPITFGHRGARAHARENTLESFALALRLGATGLESDVWLTAEGIAVLDHDGVVKRGLRRHPIKTIERADLPAHIPTLDELFDACGTDYDLSLDLKDPDAGETVCGVVRNRDPSLLGRTWLCDEDFERCLELRSKLPDIKLVNTTRVPKMTEGPERRAAAAAAAGLDAINMHRTEWNGGLVALFHRFELYAFGWDMQMHHQLQSAFRMGLDAVYSDHVDLMQDLFAEEVGGHPAP